MESLSDIRNDFVDRVGSLAASLGLNGAVGQIYAFLYISGKPESLQDIADGCQMSKGNASINIRELEAWGAVYRIKVRGDRRDFYNVNPDITNIVISKLRTGLERRIADGERILDDAGARINSVSEAELSEEDREQLNHYKQQLAHIKSLRKSAAEFLENIDSLKSLFA